MVDPFSPFAIGPFEKASKLSLENNNWDVRMLQAWHP